MFHVVVPAKSALDISPWYKRLFMQTYLHTCLSLYFVYEDYVSSWKRYIVQERFVLSKIKSYFLTYDGIHKCAINFNVSYFCPDCPGSTSFFWNTFSVGQIVSLHSAMSAREHFKRKSGFRLRRFITRNLHISKGWHRKQKFVDHIKSFLFFIFVSDADVKYLLVFAKSFWSSCSGENSDPVALILCLGPKKILGSFDPSEGKIPLRKNASSDVGKNVFEQIVDSETRPGIFDLFAKNKNMFPQKIPVRIIGRWTSFFPRPEELSYLFFPSQEHFLHQCSLKNCLFACNRSSWLLLRAF